MISRKLISIIMVLAMLLCVCSFSVSAEEESAPFYWVAETPDIAPEELPGTVVGLMGDADKNSNVNVKDATTIQKHVAGIATIDEIALNISDVDFSDNINVKDATAIQKWVAGIVAAEESFISHAMYEAFTLDERVFGKWVCTTDVGAQINELLPILLDDPMVSEYINIRSCEVTETYEFFDDYSYTIMTDKQDVEKATEIIKSDLADGLLDYMVAITKESGYDITAEDLLEAMGYASIEEYIDDNFPIDMLFESTEPVVAYYRTTPDGKIYLDEFTDTYYNFYTIEGNTLKITGDNENLMPELYPIVLEKAN